MRSTLVRAQTTEIMGNAGAKRSPQQLETQLRPWQGLKQRHGRANHHSECSAGETGQQQLMDCQLSYRRTAALGALPRPPGRGNDAAMAGQDSS